MASVSTSAHMPVAAHRGVVPVAVAQLNTVVNNNRNNASHPWAGD